jgi:holo-[acyl-carrier protein] synthase
LKLVGHGIDIVSLPDFRRLMESSETAFISRTFVQSEIAQFPEGPSRVQHIAGRFAAKEATLKALGVGFGNGISFKDIQITRDNGRPPIVTLGGGAAAMAQQIGITNWQLSISHSEGTAIASVIATAENSIPDA